MHFKHGSLFSGIGGFDLASEWMGWENVFHCEWNEFGQKVLNYYWPKAISYADITKTDFTIHRGKIDILTGGFPCQPFSGAGKRKGKEDNRYLWPEMLRAIKEIQPTWIVAENVYGIINQGKGMVFEQVQAEMENEGYQVQSYLLPACAVDAPHRRDRFWFIAYSNSNGNNRSEGNKESIWQQQSEVEHRNRRTSEINGFSNEQNVANTGNVQWNKEWEKGQQCGTGGQSFDFVERVIAQGNITDTESVGQQSTGHSRNGRTGFENSNIITSNSNGGIGCERGMHKTGQQTTERHISSCNTWDNQRIA